MSVERGAWSSERKTGVCLRAISGLAASGSVVRCFRGSVIRRALGFTLIEVMVTVAIIAIMSALLTPAVRGLLGVTGPRGGMNTLASTLEQARLSGMESGMPTYVGFPFAAPDPEAGYSSFIVFRQSTEQEREAGGGDFTPVSRWMRMSQGVYLESDNLGTTESIGIGTLPKLGTEEVSQLNVLQFDRFGKLRGVSAPVVIRVGSKREPTGEFIPDPAKSFYELTVQPLTGRTTVLDKAREGEK